MAEAMAPVSRYSDVKTPEIRGWWDSGTWTAFEASVDALAVSTAGLSDAPARFDPAPSQIPDLVTEPGPEPGPDGSASGTRELEQEVAQLRQTLDELGVTERDKLWMELVDLNSQIPAMRHELDRLRTELVDLNGQIAATRHERDELLTVVSPLRTEVSDLRSRQRELASLTVQIRELRHQKSSLDRELLAHLRATTDQSVDTRTTNRFHDS